MKPSASVVIPVYNEEGSLAELIRRLKAVCSECFEEWEVIIVDDGSTDGSFPLLKKLKQEYAALSIIRFKRNFGKTSALAAAFSKVRFDLVVTMDGDLQDIPEEIPHLLQAFIEEEYDMVIGWKYPRKDPLHKVIPSRVFNLFLRIMTGRHFHDVNCGFKIFKKEVIGEFPLYGDLHRFIPYLIQTKGFVVGEKKVAHQERRWGRSKYTYRRFWGGFLDSLTVLFLLKFQEKPLHFFGSLGIITAFTGFLVNMYLTVLWLQGHPIGHRPLLILGVLLFVIGVQFLGIGLIAEMIRFEKKKYANYVIEEVIE